MDQAQNRALAALQPFLHLAHTTKSPSPRVLADLITRATSAQGTYSFAELLHNPAVQSLRSEDHPEAFRSHFTLLEIFSYGTLKDYKNTPGLPNLTQSQEHKLSLLTLLSVASEPYPLTYSRLIPALYLPSPSALESLVTEAIYNDLITARLSPTSNPPAVHISSIAPLRDLRPSSLPQMLKVLHVWERRCTGVINEVEAQIADIKQNASKRRKRELQRQEMIEDAVLNPEASKDYSAGPSDSARWDKATKMMGMRGAAHKDTKKNRGVGSKRDLDEQQEDEISSRRERHRGGTAGAGEEDGGVGLGVARMEVDEGGGLADQSEESGRTAKRAVGKKWL